MKRGSSGLSLVIGVDKPIGMSSHDVVSRARRILGERRIGHAGTLDPFASGVLLLLVGPAARLDKHLTSHDKEYVADIAFGFSTETDDLTGDVLHECDDEQMLERLLDPGFASAELGRIVGESMRLPPLYSAIKRSGRKACDEARKGNIIELDPRSMTIYSAELVDIIDGDDYEVAGDADVERGTVDSLGAHDPDGRPSGHAHPSYSGSIIWRVRLSVSKGTYIRSIARDLGIAVGVPAHLSALRRMCSGGIPIGMCVTLDQLEADGASALLDPVAALGFRLAFADGDMGKRVGNGGSISLGNVDGIGLFEPIPPNEIDECGCLPSIVRSQRPLQDGELVSIVVGNHLKAIYAYDAKKGQLVPDCVLSIGAARG